MRVPEYYTAVVAARMAVVAARIAEGMLARVKEPVGDRHHTAVDTSGLGDSSVVEYIPAVVEIAGDMPVVVEVAGAVVNVAAVVAHNVIFSTRGEL